MSFVVFSSTIASGASCKNFLLFFPFVASSFAGGQLLRERTRLGCYIVRAGQILYGTPVSLHMQIYFACKFRQIKYGLTPKTLWWFSQKFRTGKKAVLADLCCLTSNQFCMKIDDYSKYIQPTSEENFPFVRAHFVWRWIFWNDVCEFFSNIYIWN